ncbi:GH24420 [Drosophila grimshawi]|uniref:GH24420 n=1 Tax=Drosophila grimshawi TaxID=7222 RepID=B4JM04_DROGR|nr:GH24420 [Drosophila grimshawi]
MEKVSLWSSFKNGPHNPQAAGSKQRTAATNSGSQSSKLAAAAGANLQDKSNGNFAS